MSKAGRIATLVARGRNLWTRLRRDQRGSVAVFLGIALVPLVAAIGIGVDSARGYLVRSRLSQSLDSAALAGGRVMFESYRDADVQMYFTSNFPQGYLGATVTTPVITPDANNENLTVTATATLPATFMQIFGQSTITVKASTTINRTNRGMELALVLDNTYSMASNSKMVNLKTAANTLLDILFGEDDTAANLTVGVVPFVAMVNVGAQHADWTAARPSSQVTISTLTRSSTITGSASSTSNPRTYYACATVSGSVMPFRDGQMVDVSGAAQTDYNGRRQIRRASWPASCTSAANKFWYVIDNHGSGGDPTTPATGTIIAKLPTETFTNATYTSTNGAWKGCVEQRFDPSDPTDPWDTTGAETAPAVKPFYKAFDPSSVGMRFYDSTNKAFHYQCTTNNSTSGINGGANDCDNNWDATHIVENGAQTQTYNNRGPNKGCAVPILPLQSSRAAVSASIETMQPWNGGGTNIPIGLAWGWRVLSPNYRGLWGNPTVGTQPFDYNMALIDKVVVLLSDGANTALEGGLPGCNGSHGSYNCAPNESEYTGYGRLTGGGFNTTSLASAPAQSDSRVTTMCTLMKAKGIIIYTIMLEEPDPAIGAVFQGCATKPEYYFQATSGSLNSIFQKIANQLSNLRLSK
ncbi:MAG: pilus assembly protein [Alphaproteobacteria bacterium]|nr:pilus assembly protein [Alphaproteobacteria bacterium]